MFSLPANMHLKTVLNSIILISKYSTLLTLSTFCLRISICSGLYSKDVISFDPSTFKQKIGGPLPHFVNFFAPWCGYCKRLKPVWDELGEKYNRPVYSGLVIAKVDCTIETALCSDEGITGYPSLLFYEGGQKTGLKFEGKRDMLGLEEFISKYLDKKDSVPGHVQNTVIGPLELNDANAEKALMYGMHFVLFYVPWCGHCQRLAPVWLQLADSLKHDRSVTISQVDCKKYKKICEDFEVTSYPTLLWINNGKIFEKYSGERNLDSLKEFIINTKEMHKKTLELEEGRIPEASSHEHMVVELTAENFGNAINRGLTFVKFFVPWCGHCKRLEPIWNDLAVKYVSNPLVKIAKVDCTQHEELCTEHKVQGYPTLYVFREGKFITEYHGDRKLENLHSFVLEHVQHTEL